MFRLRIFLVIAVTLIASMSVGVAQAQGQYSFRFPSSTELTGANALSPDASDSLQVVREVDIVLNEWSIEPADHTFTPGERVIFNITNAGRFGHALEVSNTDIHSHSATIGAGQTTTLEVTFDSGGAYNFLCPIPGHAAQGMIGSIDVPGGPAAPDNGYNGIALMRVNPRSGTVVEGSSQEVSVILHDFTLAPNDIGSGTNVLGEGYWELFLNDELMDSVGETSFTLENLTPGEHSIRAELRNNDGTPLAPPVVASTSIQVPTPPGTINVSEHAELGNILTDIDGNTLYLFTRDERGVSNCSGGCAAAWPPLLTEGEPNVGEGLAANRIGTTTRGDGSTQVTYNGWPLYYYAQDGVVGDTNGQAVNNVWWVVSPFGGPVQNNAVVNVFEHPDFGMILADRDNRVQYLFTPDERNVTNCSGGCALAWPPLLTIGAPVAGDGVNAGRLGIIERADGGTQVTYNGWPLYYYARDDRPGDANGQSVNRWWVVSTFGGPIETNAGVQVSENALGNILTDTSTGRTLYMFTPDLRRGTTCSGGCALAWPPLLTAGAPAAGNGAQASLLSTITRPDGGTQVTYNGWPLYFYANDAKPGDTIGQESGDRWFVMTSEGRVIPGLGQSIPPTGPRLPGVGEPSIPMLAEVGLIASLAFIASGGLILFLHRRRLATR